MGKVKETNEVKEKNEVKQEKKKLSPDSTVLLTVGITAGIISLIGVMIVIFNIF